MLALNSYSQQEAHIKLQDAEKERIKLQDKVKLWKTPNIGLARPIQPKVDPLITHRGKGAFCDGDFVKHQDIVAENSSDSKEDLIIVQSDKPTSDDPPSTSVDNERICANKDPNESQQSKTTEHENETNFSENTNEKNCVTNGHSDSKTDAKNSDNIESGHGEETKTDTENSDIVDSGHDEDKTDTEKSDNVESSEHGLSQNRDNKSEENVNRLSGDKNLYANVKPGMESDSTENKENLESIETTNVSTNDKGIVNTQSGERHLYENVKSDPIENGDNVDTVDTPNITAYDNMIYESVELKIVEPGD